MELVGDGSKTELIQVRMPMVSPLRFAGGVVDIMPIALVRCVAEGVEGWGECSALPQTVKYNGYTAEAEYEALRGFVEDGCRDAAKLKKHHPPAFAAWANANLDFVMKAKGASLLDVWGFSRDPVAISVAVSLGEAQEINRWVAQGVRAFKCKITPQTALEEVVELVKQFPTCAIGLDANGSFAPSDPHDRATLRAFLNLPIAYLEQPFPPAAWEALAHLVDQALVPIFVDESLVFPEASVLAASVGASLTLKQGVVGGVEAARVLMRQAGIAGQRFRIGGMCETGIGRAAAFTLAAHADARAFAAEVSPDGRWYEHSLVRQPCVLHDGTVALPMGSGFGVTVDRDEIEAYRV